LLWQHGSKITGADDALASSKKSLNLGKTCCKKPHQEAVSKGSVGRGGQICWGACTHWHGCCESAHGAASTWLGVNLYQGSLSCIQHKLVGNYPQFNPQNMSTSVPCATSLTAGPCSLALCIFSLPSTLL